jgi:hypothetical protein
MGKNRFPVSQSLIEKNKTRGLPFFVTLASEYLPFSFYLSLKMAIIKHYHLAANLLDHSGPYDFAVRLCLKKSAERRRFK